MANDKLKYSKLGGSTVTFQNMIKRFGVVTVMNAEVYDTANVSNTWGSMHADAIIKAITGTGAGSGVKLCELNTLKIANVTEEGPDKTVTGGQYNNPLIKFGKSARLEMQDALGNAAAIDALCGGIMEGSAAYNTYNSGLAEAVYGLHFGEDFEGPKTIIGDTFFIDQKSGQQVEAKIIFYQFLPDSIFNLTQDAEGDATVFDMNGDLLTTTITIGDRGGSDMKHGVFYSIVDPTTLED